MLAKSLYRFKKIFYAIKSPRRTRFVLSLLYNGYLVEKGWLQSAFTKQPVDRHGNEVPWMVYSIIDFLDERLSRNLTVLEWGSGNSTVWFSRLVKSVVSLEHDEEFFNHNQSRLNILPNVEVRLFDKDSEEYINPQTEGMFDLLIVDGRNRIKCFTSALGKVSQRGCIILDNSNRPEYREVFELARNSRLKSLRFTGMAPGVSFPTETTIFYKVDNCLGI